MSLVVSFILRPRASNKIIESLHLNGHVFHLGVDDVNGFFVHRLCGCLDRGIVLIYGLQNKEVSSSTGHRDWMHLTVQSFFILPFNVSRDFSTSSTSRFSFCNHASIFWLY